LCVGRKLTVPAHRGEKMSKPMKVWVLTDDTQAITGSACLGVFASEYLAKVAKLRCEEDGGDYVLVVHECEVESTTP
jgi:hypothetical protein